MDAALHLLHAHPGPRRDGDLCVPCSHTISHGFATTMFGRSSKMGSTSMSGEMIGLKE